MARYEPDPSLDQTTQTAYRRLHRKTGIVPAKVWIVQQEALAFEMWRDFPAGLDDEHLAALACRFPEEAEKAHAARAAALAPKREPPPVAPAEEEAPPPPRRRPAVPNEGEDWDDFVKRCSFEPAPVLMVSEVFKQLVEVADRLRDQNTERDGRLDALEKQIRPLSVAGLPNGGGGVLDAVEMQLGRNGAVDVAYPPALTHKHVADVIDRRIEDLQRQIQELAQDLQEAKEFHWVGVWSPEMPYRKRNCVTHQGSMWTCISEISQGERPGGPDAPSRSWKLVVQRGRDGKSGVDAK